MRVLEAVRTMLQEKGGLDVSIVMRDQVEMPTTMIEMIDQEEEESQTAWKEKYRFAIHHYTNETDLAGVEMIDTLIQTGFTLPEGYKLIAVRHYGKQNLVKENTLIHAKTSFEVSICRELKVKI
ncbi:antigen B [Listeria monocytogenes str. 4b H7858]|nr:protein LmaB [Listeria monocytogenes]EAL10196.1 antigen B [Listeria monocytogenes str. 4b H7858] [Listeria monocytogenes serotype 4b str. H7858]